MTDWRPSARLDRLQARARLYRRIRAFFSEREVLEVETPLLGAATVTDPYIDSVTANLSGQDHYLQTSPEYAMKRLLAGGSGPIYSLGKAFRNDERGPRHNPEFTLLEWYRPGFDDHQLMDEVAELLRRLIPDLTVQKFSYREWFVRHLELDPHTTSATQLAQVARRYIDTGIESDDRDLWLNLLTSHLLEARLGEGLTFIYDYPDSQAALARITCDSHGQPVARRFEAFLNGIELANGYWELTDAQEQRRRFQADLRQREDEQRPVYPLDEKLLRALAHGLPDAAGVALGIDRLLMCLTGADTITEVLAFDQTSL